MAADRDLRVYRALAVCALGKAAGPMLAGWRAGARRAGLGDAEVEVVLARGGHPEPDAASLEAGAAMLAAAQALARGPKPALLVALVSGGGSSMAEAPRSGGLEELRARNRELVLGGAAIADINRERIAHSRLKGGGLAAAAAGCDVVTWIMSDVAPGDAGLAAATVASGPTVPGSAWHILADNHDACAALARCAREDGFAPVTLDATADEWEDTRAAAYLLGRWRALRARHPRPCLIAGGEVRVRVPPEAWRNGGRGGRNQHLALRMATLLQPGEPGMFFSAGSDGVDGFSDAAGACVDAATAPRARALGLDPEDALRRFDAHPLLDAVGALVRTGPTGNNLRDLRVFC